MGARQKLNQAHVNGALIVAGILGLVTSSWTVFFIAGAVLIGLAVHSGGIRSKGHNYRGSSR